MRFIPQAGNAYGPSRSADLVNLDLNRRTYAPDGVTFLPTMLAKQSRQQKHGTEFFFPSYIIELAIT